MNEYDSNRILDIVKDIGYTSTTNISEADCYILNTCHIREKATDKMYHDIGRLKKEFRNKKKPILLIAGCVAQAEGEIILKKESYVDGIIGPQSYHQVSSMIKNIENKRKKINLTEFEVLEKFEKLNIVKNSNSKVSAFLTIQEGCDKFCKFCVVPYTRGPEHSRPFNDIIYEAKTLINNGAKEITLLGQNVNAYKFQDYRLSHLIKELNTLTNLDRIRYTTSHPNDVTIDLIEAHISCNKLMPLLHLPVQSGSTKILNKMNRKHTVEDYLNTIKKLKTNKPTMKFSSDFIIAYPGEKEKDFQKTLTLLKEVQFINTFSFLYSPRPGTPAAENDSVNLELSKERLKIFQEEALKIKNQYRNSLIETTASVLFENKIKHKDEYFGRDEFYNSVIVKTKKNLIGRTMNVKIKECNQNTLFGNLKNHNQENVAA